MFDLSIVRLAAIPIPTVMIDFGSGCYGKQGRTTRKCAATAFPETSVRLKSLSMLIPALFGVWSIVSDCRPVQVL